MNNLTYNEIVAILVANGVPLNKAHLIILDIREKSDIKMLRETEAFLASTRVGIF